MLDIVGGSTVLGPTLCLPVPCGRLRIPSRLGRRPWLSPFLIGGSAILTVQTPFACSGYARWLDGVQNLRCDGMRCARCWPTHCCGTAYISVTDRSFKDDHPVANRQLHADTLLCRFQGSCYSIACERTVWTWALAQSLVQRFSGSPKAGSVGR